jgi:hypothetical protein
MRSELTEIALIDRYLLRQLDDNEWSLFRVALLTEDGLHEKVQTQALAHRLIRCYARQEEHRRLECIYRQLCNEPAFANQIQTLFS